MDAFTRIFIVGVIALDLLAIVYFGGHFLATGHILPHADEAHAEQLAQLVPVADAANAHAQVKAKKEIPLLPASVERGSKVAALCLSCHSFTKNGRVMTGPPVWDIFGKELASFDGYQYSRIFLEKKAAGVVWNEETLDAFLKSPRKFAKGTKMSFAGLRKEQQRIDLIAYLKTLK